MAFCRRNFNSKSCASEKTVTVSCNFSEYSFFSVAQEYSRLYKTRITVGGGSEIYGTLYQIKDSSVLIANSLRKMDLQTRNFDLATISPNNISFITIREKKDVSKGIRIGMLAGASAGLIIGIIGTTKESKNETLNNIPPRLEIGLGWLTGGLFGAGVGAGVGAGTGAIISSISVGIRIPIFGNFERFNENKDRLKQYSYMH